MLDTRRIEIECFAGFEVDARCRIFAAGSFEPLPCEWPYVTLGTEDIKFSLKAPEVCALAFLGPHGCDAVFRELYMENVTKGHPRIKAIALERGISQWAVMEAARRHHSAFRVSSILDQLRSGRFGPSMWLHRIDDAVVQGYEVHAVAAPGRSEGLSDHVVTVVGVKYRMRKIGSVPMALVGDRVSFSFRNDREGGLFIVLSSFERAAYKGR
jgi:hypothetical protein